MSLSSAFSVGVLAQSSGLSWWGLAALVAYALAALAPERWTLVGGPALVVGLLAHVALLVRDVGSLGAPGTAARLGFGPVLSLTVCLMVAVHALESRLVPVPRVRRALAVAGALAVALAIVFPGEWRMLGSRWAPVHWLLGVGAYGLFAAAVLHALLLDESERRLRAHGPSALRPGGIGMPLLQLERLTFRFVQAGFVVLSLAIVLGVVTGARWRLDHKTVLSFVSWFLFAGLLAGRHWRGWRGRQATRWVYAGALVLLLAYAGTRFVAVVLLGRSPV